MTIRKTARFTVQPDGLDRALEAIDRFVAHTETETGTTLYVSWRSEVRPNEFLHLMSFVDADAEQAHATSDAVRAFTETLYPLCVEPPAFEDWQSVRGNSTEERPPR
jgi:quinol monooxygenase YgiN